MPQPTAFAFIPIVCVSASMPVDRMHMGSFVYLQGAADDEEAWAHHLRAEVFHANWSRLLTVQGAKECERVVAEIVSAMDADEMDIDKDTHFEPGCVIETTTSALPLSPPPFPAAADAISSVHPFSTTDLTVAHCSFSNPVRASGNSLASLPCSVTPHYEYTTTALASTCTDSATNTSCTLAQSLFSHLYPTNIFIGSRRAGRPPQCWLNFDAIINCTMEEYNQSGRPPHCSYMHVAVPEGKKARRELETMLESVLIFAGAQLRRGKRLLIHCNQGIDRYIYIYICITERVYVRL